MKAIHGGTLIDGFADEPRRTRRSLSKTAPSPRCRRSRLGKRPPPHATVLDHGDQTVLPGLIDALLPVNGWHEHDPMTWLQEGVPLATARATAGLRTLVDSGFTTIRDVAASPGWVKAAVEEGSVPGPRSYTSQRLISQTAGHGVIHVLEHGWVADSQDWVAILAGGAYEFRRKTRKLVRKGST